MGSASMSIASAPVVESKKAFQSQCASENTYQKTLLVTEFNRVNPGDANAGRLFEVDRVLPQLLTDQLGNLKATLSNTQLDRSIAAPSMSSNRVLAQQLQQLARSQHSQLVLTGRILDMSMPDPARAYEPSYYDRFMNGLFDFIEVKNHFDKRDRFFKFEIDLRDGITGESVYSKHYDTYGIWNTTDETGFGSPKFWVTDYGQQIKGLIKRAAKDIGQAINCQPFIAAIDSRPGQVEVLIQGGANNGLHAGDNLSLYQLIVQGSESEYQIYHSRLVNRNIAVELKEVYPDHSLGLVDTTSYLNGQYLAVAP